MEKLDFRPNFWDSDFCLGRCLEDFWGGFGGDFWKIFGRVLNCFSRSTMLSLQRSGIVRFSRLLHFLFCIFQRHFTEDCIFFTKSCQELFENCIKTQLQDVINFAEGDGKVDLISEKSETATCSRKKKLNFHTKLHKDIFFKSICIFQFGS